MSIKYKPYFDYKDIKLLFNCDITTSYRILEEVLKNVDKERMPPFKKKVVPTDILIKMYPSVKACIKK